MSRCVATQSRGRNRLCTRRDAETQRAPRLPYPLKPSASAPPREIQSCFLPQLASPPQDCLRQIPSRCDVAVRMLRARGHEPQLGNREIRELPSAACGRSQICTRAETLRRRGEHNKNALESWRSLCLCVRSNLLCHRNLHHHPGSIRDRLRGAPTWQCRYGGPRVAADPCATTDEQ